MGKRSPGHSGGPDDGRLITWVYDGPRPAKQKFLGTSPGREVSPGRQYTPEERADFCARMGLLSK